MIENYKILVDTREQKNQHILEVLQENNINYEKIAIETGDYKIKYKNKILPITIERKSTLSELISNLLDDRKDKNGNNRFIRELERAKVEKIKVIILIEQSNWYERILTEQYISRAKPKSIRGIILSLQAKYPNIQIVGIDKKISGSYIHWLLYYHLYEHLKKNGKDVK